MTTGTLRLVASNDKPEEPRRRRRKPAPRLIANTPTPEPTPSPYRNLSRTAEVVLITAILASMSHKRRAKVAARVQGALDHRDDDAANDAATLLSAIICATYDAEARQ
jgi:hypothetical protein